MASWRDEFFVDLIVRGHDLGIRSWNRDKVEKLIRFQAEVSVDSGYPKSMARHYVKAARFKPVGMTKLLNTAEKAWPGYRPPRKRICAPRQESPKNVKEPPVPPSTGPICIACGDTGKNSKGGVCIPCKKPVRAGPAVGPAIAPIPPSPPASSGLELPPPPPPPPSGLAPLPDLPIPPSQTSELLPPPPPPPPIQGVVQEVREHTLLVEVRKPAVLLPPSSPPLPPTLEQPLPPTSVGQTYGEGSTVTKTFDKPRSLRCCIAVRLKELPHRNIGKEVVIETFRSYVVKETQFGASVTDATPLHDCWWDLLVEYSIHIAGVYEVLLEHEWVEDGVAKPAADFGVKTLATA